MKYLRYVLCILLVLALCVSASALTITTGNEESKRWKAGTPFQWAFDSDADPDDEVEWLIQEQDTDEWPDGLDFDNHTGEWSGTPNVADEYKLHVTVRTVNTEAPETSDEKEFTLIITPADYGADEGGSGGCDSGFGLLGLAAVFMLCKKNSCHFLSA